VSTDATAGVRVLCGAFEDLVAIGLRELLGVEPSIDLLAVGVGGDELPAAIGRLEPDVAIVDYGSLPTPGAVQRLHDARPETRIVVLANSPTASDCNQLLSFGATACIPKETQARDIVSAIHLASRGLHLLPGSATAALGLDGGDPDGPERLTLRESEVLEMLQDGRTNGEIAHALSIGIETVRTHARNIYRKLGVSSRRELVRAARREPPAAPPIVLEPPPGA
jgi:two-component system, NarL family, response regulator LiaR